MVSDFAEAVYPLLDKNTQSLIDQSCLIINHDQSFAPRMMAYSAETDPAYLSRDKNLYSKSYPDGSIRMNFTEKFIEFLQFAKDERKGMDPIQPGVLALGGSYLVRNASIAAQFKAAPLLHLRKHFLENQNVVSDGVTKYVTDYEIKVRYERKAIAFQNEFLKNHANDLIPLAGFLSNEHPAFLEEVRVRISNVNGEVKCEEKSALLFDGEYRIMQIVRDVFVTRSSYDKKDLPPTVTDEGKKKLEALASEWNSYMDDDIATILVGVVMKDIGEPFISRYKQEMTLVTDVLK